MAMFLDYKLKGGLGKGFLRNLNIRIHRDITGEMWFGVGVFSDLLINQVKQFIRHFAPFNRMSLVTRITLWLFAYFHC